MVKLYAVRTITRGKYKERIVAFPGGEPTHYERFVEEDTGVVWYRPALSQAVKPKPRLIEEPQPVVPDLLPPEVLTAEQRECIIMEIREWVWKEPKQFKTYPLPTGWKRMGFSWDAIMEEVGKLVKRGVLLRSSPSLVCWYYLNPKNNSFPLVSKEK